MSVVKLDLAFDDMAPALIAGEYERLHAWVLCHDSSRGKEKLHSLLYPLFLYSFLLSVQHVRNSIRKSTNTEDPQLGKQVSEDRARTLEFFKRHKEEFSRRYAEEVEEVESAASNVMNVLNAKDESTKDIGTIRCYLLTKFVVVADMATFECMRRYISEQKLDRMELIFCTYISPHTRPISTTTAAAAATTTATTTTFAPPGSQSATAVTENATVVVKRDPELLGLHSSSPSLSTSLASSSMLSPLPPSSSPLAASSLQAFASQPQLTLSQSSSSVSSPLRAKDDMPTNCYTTESGQKSVGNGTTATATAAALHTARPARNPATVLMTTFYGTEKAGLNTATFSPNGHSLAAGFDNGAISLWTSDKCFTTGILAQHTLHGHSGPVYGVAFEQEQQQQQTCGWMASCGSDGTARLWDVSGRMECIRCFKGHALGEPLWDIAWSTAGKYFATAGHDKTALMWSPWDPKPVRVFVGHQADVTCLCFHPNGTYLVTASDDCYARVWDVITGKCVRLVLLTAPAARVAVSPSGKHFVVGFHDGSVRAFDIKAGRAAAPSKQRAAVPPQPRAPQPVYALGFSGDGASLAVGCEESVVRVWDASDDGLAVVGDNYGLAQTFYTRNTPVYALSYVSPSVILCAGPYNRK